MKTRVIYPPNIHWPYERDCIVFLAGPIQGARNWQADAVSYITKAVASINPPQPKYQGDPEPEVVIANPRTPDPWHGDFDAQSDWETRWLAAAATRGCILFWCAQEQTHSCDRSYAQTTRFELGEWIGRKIAEPLDVRISVGIEKGFTNERYIRRRLSGVFDPYAASHPMTPIPVHDNLKDTCTRAVLVAMIKNNGLG